MTARSDSLRAWQRRALAEMAAWQDGPFLVSAAPGAGKTRPALERARHELAAGTADAVLVACPAVAAARGVPVRALGLLTLALLGATTAEATQAIGALLLIGLLAAPAGAAQRLTPNPYLGMTLSAAFAVGSTWAGLTLSYLIPKLPPSSAIIAVASGIYLFTFLAATDLRPRRPRLASDTEN